MHEVTVRLTFAVSAEKARRVLEAWWADKERRKLAMRERRRLRPVVVADVSRGTS